MSTTPQQVPGSELRNQWLTIEEIAQEYNRDIRTVSRWCRDGTLTVFGFKVIRTQSRRWWIRKK